MRANTRTRAVALIVVILTAFVACGGNGDNHLSDRARDRLQTLTRQVRVAAAAQDRARTRQKLDDLRREVARYERTGDIGAARARRVLDDVAAVQAQLVLLPAPTTTTEAPTTTSTPEEGPDQGKGKGHEKGDGPGKGKGKKDD